MQVRHGDRSRPVIGISLGDPAGIGPEIIVKALAEPRVHAVCRPLVIGQREFVERALKSCGLDLGIRAVPGVSDAGDDAQTIACLSPAATVDAHTIEMGKVQADAGRAAYAAIELAVRLALAGEVEGIVTGPINKEAVRAAGIPHIGHTEMLAALSGVRETTTMFQVGALRIFFFTRHVALAEACRRVKRAPLYAFIRRVQHLMLDLGAPTPRLAVAALNPHAGDGGLLGREEIEEVIPAVQQARADGIDVTGPIGADSVFHQALRGHYDGVISLYHDQGHIASKTYDFDHTVSLTLGLPFIRASVDHGTAFDIAGKGLASAAAQIEALLVAARYIAAAQQRGGPAPDAAGSRARVTRG